jgi:hypothetical protein
MAKRITDLKDARLLVEAWLESLPRQPDHQRTLESFESMLFREDAAWYEGPTSSSFIFITDINQDSAAFHALNADGKRALADIGAVRQLVKEIMSEHTLRRLVSFVPSPLNAVKRAARDIGFQHVGTLRQASMFNGKPVGLDIFDLLYEEFDIQPKRKRSRRSRRKRRAKHLPDNV